MLIGRGRPYVSNTSDSESDCSDYDLPSTSAAAARKKNFICRMCGSGRPGDLVHLCSIQLMKNNLCKEMSMASELCERTLSSICLKCICKLSLQSEYSQKVLRDLHRINKKEQARRLKENLEKEAEAMNTDETAAVSNVENGKANNDNEPTTSRAASTSTDSTAGDSTREGTPQSTASSPVDFKTKTDNKRWRWHTRLECQYCKRAYFRRDYFTSHVRRCWRTFIKEPDKDQFENFPRSYRCIYCNFETLYIGALRKHRRQHFRNFYCQYCGKDFNTEFECESHTVICKAEKEALINTESTTRSGRGIKRKAMAPKQDYRNVYSTNYPERHTPNYDDCDNLSMHSEPVIKYRTNYVDSFNHIHRNRVVGELLDLEHSANLAEEDRIPAINEHDIRLLHKFMAQAKVNNFSCLVRDCKYRIDTLQDIMNHDFESHWNYTWYYCKKCGGGFTNKLFLDYHLERQNPGKFICYKCHDEFRYQSELDLHFLKHETHCNFFCHHCRMQFITPLKLYNHCELHNHMPNDVRPLVRYDRSLTITNPTPNEQQKKPKQTATKNYQVFILPIKSINVPNQIVDNFYPLRKKFGRCEVEPKENCVACR